jgi:hypothetical protein
VVVQLRQALEELVAGREALEVGRDERRGGDGLVPVRQRCAERGNDAGEDSQLSGDVGAVEVVAGMGLLCDGEDA